MRSSLKKKCFKILDNYLKDDTYLIDSRKVIKKDNNKFFGIENNFNQEVSNNEVIIILNILMYIKNLLY